MLSKMLRMAALFDLYGPLLTERQREMCCLYYLNDYSLSEISELHGVSRQAVHDTLVRAEKAMEEYEKQFGLIRCSETRRRQLDELAAALSGVSDFVDRALHALGGESGSDSECDVHAARIWLAGAVSAVEGCRKAATSMGVGTDLSSDYVIDERKGGL
jgi:predicted DNA-binding protein YlxM (UPF0122 family)